MTGFAVGLFSDLGVAARTWIATGSSIDGEPGLADYYAKRQVGDALLLEALQQWSERK